MKVLVVDDDALIRELFAEGLADVDDVEVVCEASGFRAMRRVNDEPFDLMFTDIKMPGLDGVGTVAEVKRLQPDLKVIVITGQADESEIEQALANGAEFCMKKPFGVLDIRHAVEQARTQSAGDSA